MTLRTPNYGDYGVLLIMGNAGFISSTVGRVSPQAQKEGRIHLFGLLMRTHHANPEPPLTLP